MSEGSLVLLAFLAGISLSVIGFCYRVGKPRGVAPLQIIAVVALAGAVNFGLRSLGHWQDVPARVIVLGILGGLTQYVAVALVRVALGMGPLAPLWCAIQFYFIPAILYARWVLGEPVGALQYVSFVLAALCIFSATLGQARARGEANGETAASARGHILRYGAVLLLICLINSLCNVAIKDLSVRRLASGDVSLMARFGDPFYLLVYATMGLGAVGDLLARRTPVTSTRWVWGLGLISSCGSVAGFTMLARAAQLPAAVVFTVTSITAIMTTSIGETIFFGERRTRYWYATVGFGACAVLLANARVLIGYLQRAW